MLTIFGIIKEWYILAKEQKCEIKYKYVLLAVISHFIVILCKIMTLKLECSCTDCLLVLLTFFRETEREAFTCFSS